MIYIGNIEILTAKSAIYLGNVGSNSALPWYRAYNNTKHDRHGNFSQATFESLIDAVCGLVVILASQFMDNDFGPSSWGLAAGWPNDGFEDSIGGYFRIQYPNDWPPSDQYDFDWQALEKHDPDPFDQIIYP